MRVLTAVLILAAGFSPWTGAALADPDVAVDYLRDVKPVLRDRCTACHGSLKQEGGLRLDTAVQLRSGGDSGAAITPHDVGGSLLIQRITATEDHARMPPEGKPLLPQQIAAISQWVEQGAASPADEPADQDPRDHWAFRRPVRPILPVGSPADTSRSGRLENAIDLLIRVQREAAGLSALPPADRLVLLRRVSLDLIGLPPTPAEIESFLADDSATAWARTVDRLLDAPQYGERWGRHWMDVWRYSDWYGRRAVPDVMNSYPMIWRWRDWIVRSLNEDKPYDQMVREMLAADELLPTDDQNIAATGYLVRSWFKWNYETWKKDLVEHTGKAFLGLTLNCAQCHDHKYDPIAQEEYFRFRAFFEPLELRHDRVAGEPDPGPFEKYIYGKAYGPIKSGMIRVFDEQLNAETWMFVKGDSRLRMEGKPPVTPAPPAVLGEADLKLQTISLPASAAYPGLKPFVQAEERAIRQAAVAQAETEVARAGERLRADELLRAQNLLQDQNSDTRVPDQPVPDPPASIQPASHLPDVTVLALAAAESKLAAARLHQESLERRIRADAARYASGTLSDDRSADPVVAELIRLAWRGERDAALAAAQAGVVSAEVAVADAQVKDAASAGQTDQAARDAAAKAVQAAQAQTSAAAAAVAAAEAELQKEPAEYTPLSPKFPSITTGRRAALARWITSRDNPLTARVAVNHIWLRHFGQALVESTQDFGRNGSRPTHPELLDWLASELMDSGWSMKHLHRCILLSESWQRASIVGESAGEAAVEMARLNSADPLNQYYWRFPPSRMQAEVVRDSLLAVAEELDNTVGGPELDQQLGLTTRRRSLYFAHHGEERMEFLELFDAPNPLDCYKRTSSVQPQQALALTNSQLTRDLSGRLAERLWSRVSGNDRSVAFVRLAFLQVLNLEPQPRELHAAVRFLDEQTARLTAEAATQGTISPEQRARQNLVHALMNHNEFVTIR